MTTTRRGIFLSVSLILAGLFSASSAFAGGDAPYHGTLDEDISSVRLNNVIVRVYVSDTRTGPLRLLQQAGGLTLGVGLMQESGFNVLRIGSAGTSFSSLRNVPISLDHGGRGSVSAGNRTLNFRQISSGKLRDLNFILDARMNLGGRGYTLCQNHLGMSFDGRSGQGFSRNENLGHPEGRPISSGTLRRRGNVLEISGILVLILRPDRGNGRSCSQADADARDASGEAFNEDQGFTLMDQDLMHRPDADEGYVPGPNRLPVREQRPGRRVEASV